MMNLREKRASFMQGFQDSRAELMAVIEGLKDMEAGQPAPDGWSIKDHLAHLAHMDELRFQEIHRVSHNFQVGFPRMSPEDMDALNDRGVALRRRMSLTQVLWELDFMRSLVLDAVKTGTETVLNESRYGEFSLTGGIAHEREHTEAIRKLRGSA